MKKILLNIHMIVGLFACSVLILLSISGTIIAFEPELNRVLHPALTRVAVNGPPMNWDAVKASVEQQAPGWKLNRFYFPDRPEWSAYARLRNKVTHTTRQIYVDQYTGKILGSTEDGPDLLIRIHDLHVNLLTGRTKSRWGSVVVVAGTWALLILSVTGIVLWFPRRIFGLQLRSPAARINRDLHLSLGFWSALAMFAFALTGLGLHYQTGKLLNLLDSSENTRGNAVLAGHGPTIEGMLQTGREALPGAAIPRLLLSEKAGDPVFLYMRFPEDKTPAGRSFVTLDPKTGRVLSVGNARTFPRAQSLLVQYTREIHTGTLWGLPTRILAALFGASLSILAVTGPLIWLNKRRAKARGRAASRARERVLA